MLRTILHVALFLCSLLGTAAGFRHLDAMPYWGWTRDKCVRAMDPSQGYDTLVVGSSRLHFGFKPMVFDKKMAELGVQTKTFNLAFSGMRPHDYYELAQWVLDNRPPGLQRLIIEITSWDPGVVGTNWMSSMQIQGHASRQLIPRIASILACNSSFADRFEKTAFAVAHTLANCLRLGQGTRIVEDLLLLARGRQLADISRIRDEGYKDVAVDPWPANLAAHKDLQANPTAVDKFLEMKGKSKVQPYMIGGFNLPAWRHMDRRLRDAGIEAIYVVMPALGSEFQGRDAVATIAQEAIVFDLDDPAAHAPLFQRALWYDRSHLANDGATFFSVYLAELVAVAPRRQEGGQPTLRR